MFTLVFFVSMYHFSDVRAVTKKQNLKQFIGRRRLSDVRLVSHRKIILIKEKVPASYEADTFNFLSSFILFQLIQHREHREP